MRSSRVAFHRDGKRLATAGRDGAVWLLGPVRGRGGDAGCAGHKSYVYSLAFSPDGATLASGSGDGTVRLWDEAPPEIARTRPAARPPPYNRRPVTLGRAVAGVRANTRPKS